MRHIRQSLAYRWLLWRQPKVYTYGGVRIHSDKDRLPTEVQKLIFKDRYENAERDLAKSVIRAGDRVLEIGCGIGLVSLVTAKIAGEGNVRSYEANPRMEQVIRDNYALNNMTPDLHMKAVTPDGGKVSFFQSDNILSSSVFDRDRAGQTVEVDAIAFADAIKDFSPTVVVMDIEGAETDVLPSDEMPGVKHLIVEIHPHIVGQDAINAMETKLAASGFGVAKRQHKTVLYSRPS